MHVHVQLNLGITINHVDWQYTTKFYTMPLIIISITAVLVIFKSGLLNVKVYTRKVSVTDVLYICQF